MTDEEKAAIVARRQAREAKVQSRTQPRKQAVVQTKQELASAPAQVIGHIVLPQKKPQILQRKSVGTPKSKPRQLSEAEKAEIAARRQAREEQDKLPRPDQNREQRNEPSDALRFAMGKTGRLGGGRR